jgi:hypothetical protein
VLHLDLIDVKILMQGHAAQGRWPYATVRVNDVVVYNNVVSGLQEVNYKTRAKQTTKSCIVNITYHSKLPNDTVVDSNGCIIENQSLEIVEMWFNGVDIVGTGLIHQDIGGYTMQLDHAKQQYFAEHGISTEPTTNNHMYENGTWKFELALPILSSLTAKHNFVEPWEDVDSAALVDQMFDLFTTCQRLEQQQHDK